MEQVGYTYYNYDEPSTNFPFLCIMGTYEDYNKRKYPSYVFIKQEHLAPSREEFIKFIKIMNFWGFPINLEEKEETYKCIFPNKDYFSDKHFLASITIFRYAIKCEHMNANGFGTNEVISEMFEYKKKYPKLSYFKCFQLACYKKMPGGHNAGHSCFKRISKLVGHFEMKKNLKNFLRVNSLFYKEEIEGYENSEYFGGMWKKMHNLVNTNEKEALKILL